LSLLAVTAGAIAGLPSSFDLRDVGPNHDNYVTPVKNQRDGTCWTYGSLAVMESNLLITGRWDDYFSAGLEVNDVPNLNEYHLDWWNGFNWHNNGDTTPAQQDGNGLETHMGGDYKVAAAYVTRGEGAVSKNDEPGEHDDQWFYTPPDRTLGNNRYYARDIVWQTVGTSGVVDPVKMAAVKTTIMEHGAVGTSMLWSGEYYVAGQHYQPRSDTRDPNHSVTIIGWDDNIDMFGTPKSGAWLAKNSWGSGWNPVNEGYLWISYHDKHAGYHPEMGAVSFQNVERNTYRNIYSHDLHGWRDTLSNVSIAMNAFTAEGDESLRAVSFYTAVDNVTYYLAVFDTFSHGMTSGQLASKSDSISVKGYHTVDLDSLIDLTPVDDFYVMVVLSDGGHAIDRTSSIPVLLGAPAVTDGTIVSAAAPGESYYMDFSNGWPLWADLHDRYIYGADVGRDVTGSANFCIKALTVLPGDADGNGTVDRRDLEILRRTFGSEIDPRADFNNDGIVDIADFALLRGNFGITPPSPSPGGEFAAVTTPEPASLVLIAAGIPLLLKRKRRN